MGHVIVRPATREDIARFSDMANKPTVRAVVGEIDGRIVGMGGIALIGGRWFAFADLPPEIRTHKMTIMRAAKAILAQAARDGIRFIYTETDPNEPRSLAWLASLGFRLDQRSQYLYRWENQWPH